MAWRIWRLIILCAMLMVLVRDGLMDIVGVVRSIVLICNSMVEGGRFLPTSCGVDYGIIPSQVFNVSSDGLDFCARSTCSAVAPHPSVYSGSVCV